jgi:hypothetical protein
MTAKNQPWQVAALIAEMMRRADLSRARISDVTLRKLSGRARLETSIRTAIADDLVDYGYVIHRLEGRGPTTGNAIISLSALHAAKAVKGIDLFDASERAQISRGEYDFDTLHDTLLGEHDVEEE